MFVQVVKDRKLRKIREMKKINHVSNETVYKFLKGAGYAVQK